MDQSQRGVTIKLLADVPEHVPEVARYIFEEWVDEHIDCGINSSKENEEEIRSELLTRDRWPTAMVALSQNGSLLGTVCLCEDDMSNRPDLKPWLASLLVKSQARGKGVGSLLIGAITEHAQNIGVECLYLWVKVQHRDIYTRRGFTDYERLEYCGNDIVIMRNQLLNPDSGSQVELFQEK